MAKARGFTLMEAALALAIVGIVAIAAISLYAAVTRTFTTTRKTSILAGRAQNGMDYLVHELRSVGGNGIPASAAIFVEDAAGIRGSIATGFPDGADVTPGATIGGKADRLTTFTALSNTPRCPITDMQGPLTSGRGTAHFALSPTQCCFTTGSTRPFVRTVMLMFGENYRPVLLTNTSGTCEFQWQDIVPAQMRRVPTTGDLNAAFKGGQAVLVDFRTIYLDPLTHDLVMHLDRTPDPTNQLADLNGFGASPSTTGERLRLLDNVFDFQISLGYDLNDDGDVTETATGSGDEWLHNIPDERSTDLANFDVRLLRLVRADLVVGLPAEGVGAGSPIRSPARSASTIAVAREILRPVSTRISPRNLDFEINAEVLP